MKENVCNENCKYDPEDMLHIAEITYTEMVEHGPWNLPSMLQDYGLVVNSTCWNCGGKAIRQMNALPSNFCVQSFWF